MRFLRRWLHHHGVHRFCRIGREPIVQRYDLSKEYLRLKNGDLVDVTSMFGRPVYEDEYGKRHFREIHQ